MKSINNFTNAIHLAIKDLIEEKSRRDKVKFTNSQLSNALCMPRSMIAKLTHPDASKRVLNPRIDTLLKIVEFFKLDGFDITVDDLLGITPKTIDIQNQVLPTKESATKISLFSFEKNLSKKIGTINVKINNSVKHLIAIYADKDIKPFFKKGSIFIIDKNKIPEDETLVAISTTKEQNIKIMKYHISNNNVFLKSLDLMEERISIKINHQINIIGSIIQVNANT